MRLTTAGLDVVAATILMFAVPAAVEGQDWQRRAGWQRHSVSGRAVLPVHRPFSRVLVRQTLVPVPRRAIIARQFQRPFTQRYYRSPIAPPYGRQRLYSHRPYIFQPRSRMVFGVFVGYPQPYMYAYPYRAPVYGYSYNPASGGLVPGANTYGGVSLDIAPVNASVYVDGAYAGAISEFDGRRQPLTLVGGTHRIEVIAPRYQRLVFDVIVRPGELVPYRGTLPRWR